MRRAIVLLTPLLLLVSASAADDPLIPEPSQNPSATYRLFRTMNIFTLLKLDTRTGQVWQVQWSNSDEAPRVTFPLNRTPLLPTGRGSSAILKPGRFTLVPTRNIFNFLLLDQDDGRTWQVQWGDEKDRLIVSIPPA